MSVFLFFFVIFLFNVGLLFAYMKISHHYHWFDQPNDSRKLHSQAIPTSAGLIFMIPMLLLYLLMPGFMYFNGLTVGVGLIVLYLVGGFDDFVEVSIKIRLITIILVSCFSVYFFFKDNSSVSYLLMGFYILGLIWWLNLYNFMDGADGMAILHALITSIGYLAVYIILGEMFSLEVMFILIFMFCLASFLLFNFPKAKIFMGDSGSLSVSFVLAGIALYGISKNIFDEVLVITFHLVFIVDATMTLLTRLKYKHSISQAHNLHLFQSLIKNGTSHTMVSSLYALVTLVLIIVSCLLANFEVNKVARLSILLVEAFILAFFWFNFYNKTKFKRFIR